MGEGGDDGSVLVLADMAHLERVHHAELDCKGGAELTFKLSYIPSSSSSPSSSINYKRNWKRDVSMVLELLNVYLSTNFVHTFLLDFSYSLAQASDEETASHTSSSHLEEFMAIWTCLSQLKKQGLIGSLGVCDLTSRDLSLLLSAIQSRKSIPLDKPEVNQVAYSFKNCCDAPHHDLIQLCREEGVEVLTYGGPSDYLSTLMGGGGGGSGSETGSSGGSLWRALLRKHGMLNERTSGGSDGESHGQHEIQRSISSEMLDQISASSVTATQQAPLPDTGPMSPTLSQFNDAGTGDNESIPCWTSRTSLPVPVWVGEYTVQARCRGLVSNNGYMLFAELENKI